MWDRQVPELAKQWRVFRFDLPGHGGAPAYPAGSVAELAERLLATLDGLGVQRFGYAGCALGGAIGLELALRHPERLASLALIAASPRFGTADEFRQRGVIVRTNGLDPIARTSPGALVHAAASPPPSPRSPSGPCRWCAPPTPAATSRPARRSPRSTYAPSSAASACRRSSSSAPTTRSPGPAEARTLVAGIPDARLAVVPGASHLVPVEQPAAVTDLLVRHFSTAWQPAYDSTTGQMAIPAAPVKPVLAPPPAGRPRRRDRAARRAARGGWAGPTRTTPGSRCAARCSATRTWTGRWPRRTSSPGTSRSSSPGTRGARSGTGPGLDRRSRSCVTLTALVAGGHLDELAFHTRAALRNGLTPVEIKEVLLQAAVYCGVPAANSAFKVAQQVIREETTPQE